METVDLLVDLHRCSDRQGPGSPQDTRRALDLVRSAFDRPLSVADLGCGTGGQTLTLATQLEGPIVAVDLFPAFLSELDRRAAAGGLGDRIRTVEASMDALPFEPAAFDLIWSEGAIYNIGFENGIRLWKELLRPGGFLAVSEITWTSHHRPAELESFWKQEYPAIDTAANKIRQLEANGYVLAGYFPLPPASWLDGYYRPLAASFPAFLARHGHSAAAQAIVREYQAETELYERYKDHYSYGFYVARKD
jgi:SAM-dependent methyltransferase